MIGKLSLIFCFVFATSAVGLEAEVSASKYENDTAQLDHIADNLIGGGPPKDGIPAIDHPKYVSATKARLSNNDVVFGIDYNGFVAAYPKKIMVWHEIVNEEIKDDKISVTYCPLTGSVIGYKGKNLGISGKLYNSNLVIYDRKTDSIYPQILGVAVRGPEKAKALSTFPVTVTTWKKWKKTHPETKVLSKATGYTRNYNRDPYSGYEKSHSIRFPVEAKSGRFRPKEMVHALEYQGEYFAVLKGLLKRKNSIKISTEKGEGLRAIYDKESDSVTVTDEKGGRVKSFDVFWFAWYAFHPDTKVIK